MVVGHEVNYIWFRFRSQCNTHTQSSMLCAAALEPTGISVQQRGSAMRWSQGLGSSDGMQRCVGGCVCGMRGGEVTDSASSGSQREVLSVAMLPSDKTSFHVTWSCAAGPINYPFNKRWTHTHTLIYLCSVTETEEVICCCWPWRLSSVADPAAAVTHSFHVGWTVWEFCSHSYINPDKAGDVLLWAGDETQHL